VGFRAYPLLVWASYKERGILGLSSVDNALAFLFPGQGSQSVGMLSGLADRFSEIRTSFADASEVLGYDLWELAEHGPEEQLNSTEYTQPAMLAAGVAVWRVWCANSDTRPGWMAGHSLGEYCALVCAGALSFDTAVRLVAERARLMQAAVPPEAGAMAALLGLEDEQVVACCKEASTRGEIVSAANFNAPGQVVIAGSRAGVERAMALAKSAGARRAVLLAVSVPSHCPLMAPAAEQYESVLASAAIQSPEIGVIHNVDVAMHPAPDVIRAALKEQLSAPVRWSESIRFMFQQGVNRFVECGPGRVLAGLNRRIVPSAKTEPVFDSDSLASALELTK
jgi:[acyl-carrier-protein] S-malonyltransferase